MPSQKNEIPGWVSGQFVSGMFLRGKNYFSWISAVQQTLLQMFCDALTGCFSQNGKVAVHLAASYTFE